ncbi:MAG TPA: DUF89 family protein [Nitrososphaeria archaeon]|nr:DUF89 family protein [Nitrososphaeria archaeon]
MLKIRPECVPCTLFTGARMAKIASENLTLRRKVVSELARRFSEVTWDEVPLDLSYLAQEIVEDVTGVSDPYEEIKRRSNSIALNHYPDLERRVAESPDPLEEAVRLSIAGNLIDFGPYAKVDFEQPFRKASEEFAINDYELFRRSVSASGSLLYFLDNAGEIVFDKLLIETMIRVRGRPFDKVSLVVKEKPLINDATLEDAEEVGLTGIPRAAIKFIGDGRGKAPSFRSSEVKSWIREHDLTIFKGQANFETFEGLSGAFFLLVVKCEVVAEALGVGVGSLVLKHSG